MSSNLLDRSLVMEAVRVTEAAAIAAWELAGRGDEKAADQAAVDAMRTALNELTIDGLIVIGEGERDEAPMLYIGEKVGKGTGPRIDIALDPLEGTTLTAKAMANALAVKITPATSPSVMTRIEAPTLRIASMIGAWRGRSSTRAVRCCGLTPLALARAWRFSSTLASRSTTPSGKPGPMAIFSM